jgi:signal transduction histidine kinase
MFVAVVPAMVVVCAFAPHAMRAQEGLGLSTRSVLTPPPWSSTRTACLLAALALAGVLGLAYRMRVRHLVHAHDVQLEDRWSERTRIARELHDTLLQEFQGLMFHLQAVRDLLPEEPGRAVPVLDFTLLKGEEVIDEARGAISELRSSEDAGRDLESGLAAVAATAALQLEEGQAPAWVQATRGRTRRMPEIVRYEVYQAAREAITNAFRHALARHIRVEVQYDPDTLHVVIVDDGVGFDTGHATVKRGGRYFGIRGMRQRIERLGGDMTLESTRGAGTRLVLSVPAAIAYRRDASTHRGGRQAWWRFRNRDGEHG